MQRIWYYAVRGKQYGPVSEQELISRIQAGELSADDIVWTEGMQDWVRIGAHAMLREYLSAAGKTAPPQSPEPGGFSHAGGLQTISFGPWLSIVGIANILTGALMTLTCIGIPVGIMMIFAGAALMGANSALSGLNSVPQEVSVIFSKFRSYFTLTGIIFLLNIAFALFALIIFGCSASLLSETMQNLQGLSYD